jgi:hypothetical protein
MKIGLLVMGPEEEPKDVNKISYTHTADCDCAEAGKVLKQHEAGECLEHRDFDTLAVTGA